MKKIIIRVSLSIVIIFVLLVGITVYHITSKKPIDNATVQISRIDFDKPFDSLGKIDIQKKLHEISGVKTDMVVERNVVVYFHEKKIANSKQVFDQLMKKGNYKAERFLVHDSIAAKSVCPAMPEDGIKYKFSRFVQSIFN
jgi:hypothetical protein